MMTKTGQAVLYVEAWCRDCNKRWRNCHSAELCALYHAEQYKHRVTVETGKIFAYDGRNKKQSSSTRAVTVCDTIQEPDLSVNAPANITQLSGVSYWSLIIGLFKKWKPSE